MQNDTPENRKKLLKILDTGVAELSKYLEEVGKDSDYTQELLSGI